MTELESIVKEHRGTIEKFVRRYQKAGEKVYGLENTTPFDIKYFETSHPFFSPFDYAIILPGDYEILLPLYDLTSIRAELAHEVSEGLADVKSNFVLPNLCKDAKLEDFDEVNWSNYLVNKGIEEGRAMDGAKRIILSLKERSVLKEHEEEVADIPSDWPIHCAESFRSIMKFGYAGNVSTSDLYRTISRPLEPSNKVDEDLLMVRNFLGSLHGPYSIRAYVLIQKLDKKRFQRFTEEWEPRCFNEKIKRINPVSYYFNQRLCFGIPREHEKIIEEEIKQWLK